MGGILRSLFLSGLLQSTAGGQGPTEGPADNRPIQTKVLWTEYVPYSGQKWNLKRGEGRRIATF
jgi:hypothetical protein